MRPLYKTTEFYLGIALASLIPACKALGVDTSNINLNEMLPAIIWIATRLFQKLFGASDTGGVRAWHTWQFWVSIAVSGAQAALPAMPPEISMPVNALLSAILGITSLNKTFENVNLSTIGINGSAPKPTEKEN